MKNIWCARECERVPCGSDYSCGCGVDVVGGGGGSTRRNPIFGALPVVASIGRRSRVDGHNSCSVRWAGNGSNGGIAAARLARHWPTSGYGTRQQRSDWPRPATAGTRTHGPLRLPSARAPPPRAAATLGPRKQRLRRSRHHRRRRRATKNRVSYVCARESERLPVEKRGRARDNRTSSTTQTERPRSPSHYRVCASPVLTGRVVCRFFRCSRRRRQSQHDVNAFVVQSRARPSRFGAGTCPRAVDDMGPAGRRGRRVADADHWPAFPRVLRFWWVSDALRGDPWAVLVFLLASPPGAGKFSGIFGTAKSFASRNDARAPGGSAAFVSVRWRARQPKHNLYVRVSPPLPRSPVPVVVVPFVFAALSASCRLVSRSATSWPWCAWRPPS